MSCEPTFSRLPDGDESTGQDAVDLALYLGVQLDEWQAVIVRGILRERDGTWAASQAGLVVARQSGKGQIALCIELYGLVVLGEQILHTAHSVKTSSDAFRRLWAVIQNNDELARRVRRHSQMVGAEYVELDDGSRVAFTTRSASAGRGLSVDRLVLDEAEDMPAAEIAALAPTTFSRPRAQVLMFGTAPSPLHDSESFENLRRTAHDGSNPRLAWFEWCAEYGDDIDDRAVWLRVNPAVQSGRVPLQAIIDDKAVLPPDSFRAERLSMWVPRNVDGVLFNPDDWDKLADDGSVPTSALALGVDVPPSRDASTVCLAGKRDDGLVHVEWYLTRPGVTWLPGWVSEHLTADVRAVVVDERNALAELDWAAANVRPTLLNHRDVAVAAGVFLDAVSEGTVRHRRQVELSKGVLSARQRPLGQHFAWDRKASGSSALIAASLALHGVTCERPLRPRRGPVRQRRVTVM